MRYLPIDQFKESLNKLAAIAEAGRGNPHPKFKFLMADGSQQGGIYRQAHSLPNDIGNVALSLWIEPLTGDLDYPVQIDIADVVSFSKIKS